MSTGKLLIKVIELETHIEKCNREIKRLKEEIDVAKYKIKVIYKKVKKEEKEL